MKKPASFQTATTISAPSTVRWSPSQLWLARPSALRDLLEQAVLRRVEEEPDVGDRDHRQHRRREEGEAQEGAAARSRQLTQSAITIASAIESGIVPTA